MVVVDNCVIIDKELWQARGFAILGFIETHLTVDYKISFKRSDKKVFLIFDSNLEAESLKILCRLMDFTYAG